MKKVTLTKAQKRAIKQAVAAKGGVLSFAPGLGKTFRGRMPVYHTPVEHSYKPVDF